MDKRTRVRRRRLRAGDLPTTGINRQIDKVFHPYFRRGVVPIIADSLAHALVERDPPKSVEKFIEYNVGPLFREALKLLRAQEKRKRSADQR